MDIDARGICKVQSWQPRIGGGSRIPYHSFIGVGTGQEQKRGSQLELNLDEMSVAAALDDHLNDRALDQSENSSDVDPVWTWNGPSHLTDDDFGIDQVSKGRATSDVRGP